MINTLQNTVAKLYDVLKGKKVKCKLKYFSNYSIYDGTTLLSQQASIQKSHFYVYMPPINNNTSEIMLLLIAFSDVK